MCVVTNQGTLGRTIPPPLIRNRDSRLSGDAEAGVGADLRSATRR